MLRHFLFFLSIIISVICVNAQYIVKGCVTDTTHVGEPYATIRFFHQSSTDKPIKVGTTDINGHFSQELASSGNYTLNITSVGKTPIIKEFSLSASQKEYNFGNLIIKSDATVLAGIEVVAQKPLITTEIDRISYDIQSDEESKTSNIFDMLRKVPMVTIDGEDKILVNGSSNYKIYKNGRPNTSWSNNPKEVFKSIPASMIKRIEVITEPGAKYDAEGISGILNIITNERSVINGIIGNVSANSNTNEMHGANAYVTTQIGKLTTSINYNFSTLGKANTVPYQEGEYHYTQSGNHLTYYGKNNINKGSLHYGNIEASYDIDTLNLITLSFGGYLFDNDITDFQNTTMSNQFGDLIYHYNCLTQTPKYIYFDFNGKLDYQHLTHRKGEALTFSYLLSTTNQENKSDVTYYDTEYFPLDYDSIHNQSNLKFYEHTFQFDWTRPFAQKHKIEMGLKYIMRQNFSKTIFEYNNGTNNVTNFNHITNIGAAYAEYSFNSKRWGARAGLRYEIAHLRGTYPNSDKASFSSYIPDIVPTLSVSYQLNNANNLKLNYSTRINRPDISYLNPAVDESPTTISFGNPNLESTRRNNLRFSYSLMKPKIVISASLGYAWANNAFSDFVFVKDNIKYNTYANNGRTRSFGCDLYAQWSVTKSTQLVLNGNISRKRYSNTQNLVNEGWGGFLYANVSQNLPWKLILNANINYWNSGINDTYSSGMEFFHYGFNISRSFLKDNRLTIKLGANNPFSNKYYKITQHTTNGDRIGYNTSFSLNRAFGINISYRFGSLKASVKKTNKTISNDDLEGRK